MEIPRFAGSEVLRSSNIKEKECEDEDSEKEEPKKEWDIMQAAHLAKV